MIAQGTMIAIAATAATWTHSKIHWKLVRSFRTMAPSTAAPNSAKGASHSADRSTAHRRAGMKFWRTGQPSASHTASAATQKIQ